MGFENSERQEPIDPVLQETIDFIKKCRGPVKDDILIVVDKESGRMDDYSKIITKLQEGEISSEEAMTQAVTVFIESNMAANAAMGNVDQEHDARHYIPEMKKGEISPQEVFEIIKGSYTPQSRQDWDGGH